MLLESVGLLERWKRFFGFGKRDFIFFSMNDSMIKTDRFGWKYFDRLPDGYRIGTIDDFHVNGIKRIGMEYLIQRSDLQHFEIHYVSEETRSINLVPFFDWDMIYVKN